MIESVRGVSLAAVVPRPDPDYFEVGVAFVQMEDGRDVEVESLRAWCREHLANYKVPKEFHTGSLELLANGKIDKRALKARARDLFSAVGRAQ